MNEQFDRLLIGSHMQVIVVDERLARLGLNRFMDFFVRYRYVREDVNLVIYTAVFKEDKLVGFLPSSDMNIVLLANDSLEQTTVSVPLPENKAFAGVRLIRLHASKAVRMLHGRPKMTLNVRGIGFIVSLGAALPIDQASGYMELERLTEAYVRERIDDTVKRVQTDYAADIFGFGEWMYRHRFGEFKQLSASWNELFAKGDLQVDVDIQLERSELKTNIHNDIQYGFVGAVPSHEASTAELSVPSERGCLFGALNAYISQLVLLEAATKSSRHPSYLSKGGTAAAWRKTRKYPSYFSACSGSITPAWRASSTH
ncbi:Ger(x)C family spore germination C-terminal domain-containing protein [Cohnella sp. GCM10012308]|uniref:Ger(x)C family spore germination C-terminal domain-containing protein n=1 Tax=Cohnella sp. GCM10012308 TaxID=3317329 RepID=UPI00360EB67F